MNFQSILLGGVTGYVLGSIPFAYIITKRASGLDVRQHGSGNVGTTNAYEVTGKKSVRGMVFASDCLKGLIPVLVFAMMGWTESLLVLIPALILGHCYPIWLKFHGGRGLATMTGVIVPINPPMLVLWCIVFLITKKIRNQVHIAAITATLITIAAILLLPSQTIELTTLPFSGLVDFPTQLATSVLLALLLILTRHIEPLMRLMRAKS